jgi:Protein of unknown function (DUF3429)
MSSRPVLPFVLGIAGLVPFVGLAIFWAFSFGLPRPTPILWIVWYGAAILSFLGGSRWGAEISNNPQSPNSLRLTLAMLPPLLGWLAAILVNELAFGAALALLIAALGFQLAWDILAIRSGIFPRWYLPLRILLTVVAVLSLQAVAVSGTQPLWF